MEPETGDGDPWTDSGAGAADLVVRRGPITLARPAPLGWSNEHTLIGDRVWYRLAIPNFATVRPYIEVDGAGAGFDVTDPTFSGIGLVDPMAILDLLAARTPVTPRPGRHRSRAQWRHYALPRRHHRRPRRLEEPAARGRARPPRQSGREGPSPRVWRSQREGPGRCHAPMAIVWPCRLGVDEYAAAGRSVAVPHLPTTERGVPRRDPVCEGHEGRGRKHGVVVGGVDDGSDVADRRQRVALPGRPRWASGSTRPGITRRRARQPGRRGRGMWCRRRCWSGRWADWQTALIGKVLGRRPALGERVPVAGFDLTFQPPKSVSVAWARADPGLRATIEQVLSEAAGEVIAWAEQRVFRTSTRTSICSPLLSATRFGCVAPGADRHAVSRSRRWARMQID